ncbi:MAG: phosphoglucosamine mutase, partial [FCB group bacterium]
MPFIRSISGIRATIEDSFSEEIIKNYVLGFISYLPPGPITLGRDGRPSGTYIEKIITDTITSYGRDVYNLGIVPTPTIQLFVEKTDSAGGIAITASHNPAQWNGMKFINNNGVFLDKEENNKFWEIVDNGSFTLPGISNKKNKIQYENGIDKHINSILELPIFTDTDSKEKLIIRNFKVIVDAVNASGSIAVPKLLEKLGCDIIPLYCDGTGIFPHTPEPLPENLTELAKAVKNHNADIGIAVDPDADRLVLIDEKGIPVFEEYTIVLAVEAVLGSRKLFKTNDSSVVINYSTTRAVEDIALKYNAKCYRSAVGE